MSVIKCMRPMLGYYSKVINKETGKRPIVFNRSEAFSDMRVLIPCGKCPLCLRRRVREMTKRAVHEASCHEHNCFVTLTYDDEHLVPDKDAYREVQLFLMRLRKKTDIRFRYLCATEKGTNGTKRIHHHICFFGFSPFALNWRYKVKNSGKNPSYIIPKLTSVWGNGHVLVSPFSPKTAAYTCGYCYKKSFGKDCDDADFRPSEYEKVRTSRRPGLGALYFLKNKFKMLNGYKNSLVNTYIPRYYFKLLEKYDPLSFFIYYTLPRRRSGQLGLNRFVNPFDNEFFLMYPVLYKKLQDLTRYSILKRKV